MLDHSLSCLFFYFSLIRRITHFGSCVPFQALCFYFHWSAWYCIMYMALFVHHQGLREKASFDWPRYLTLTKQILSSICSCLQLNKISPPNLKQVGVGMAIIMNNWQSTSFQPGWEDLEKWKFCLVIDLADTFLGFCQCLIPPWGQKHLPNKLNIEISSPFLLLKTNSQHHDQIFEADCLVGL